MVEHLPPATMAAWAVGLATVPTAFVTVFGALLVLTVTVAVDALRRRRSPGR